MYEGTESARIRMWPTRPLPTSIGIFSAMRKTDSASSKDFSQVRSLRVIESILSDGTEGLGAIIRASCRRAGHTDPVQGATAVPEQEDRGYRVELPGHGLETREEATGAGVGRSSGILRQSTRHPP